MTQQPTQTWLQLEAKVRTGRGSLLAAIVITVINVLMVLFDADAYLFFSVTTAYYFAALGKGLDNDFTAGAWSENGIYTRTGVVLALIVLAIMLALWFFSKENRQMLRIAAVALIVDTVAYMAVSLLMTGTPVNDPVELIVHVYLIVILFQAASAVGEMERRRAVAAEEPEPPEPQPEPWEM